MIKNLELKIFPTNSLTKPLLLPKAAFLGISADGHIASLFPGLEDTFYDNEPFILIDKSRESFKRISINAKVFIDTQFLIFLVSGKSKKPVIERIIKSPESCEPLPIQRVINNAKSNILIFCNYQATPN